MKTQNEFLEALEEELRFLKAKEVHEILKHYRDKINTELDYGTPEAKIIKELPLPADIASEIYKSKGISYLEIQKKKYRQKEVIKAILSGFIITLMLVLFLGVVGFFGKVVFNFNQLLMEVSSFKAYLDSILMVGMILALDVCAIAILIFIIDLFYIIISNFLVNILKSIKKSYRVHYKFQDFSISGIIKNKCKKKNVVAIVLAGSATIALIVSFASLFTKGYIYRSLNNVPANLIEKQYDGKIKDINIIGSNANITFLIDEKKDKISVVYKYEFNDKINIEQDEWTLNIKDVKSKSFGLLGMLDEPTPIIEITLPSAEYLKNINVELNKGSLYLKKISNISLDVKANIYDGQVYIEESDIDELTITSYKTDIKIANLSNEQEYHRINKLFIGITEEDYLAEQEVLKNNQPLKNKKTGIGMGSLAMQGISVNEFIYRNVTVRSTIKTCQLNTFVFESSNGETFIYDINGNDLSFTTQALNTTLENITYKNTTFETSNAGQIYVTRLMVAEKTTLRTYSKSLIEVSRLKSKETEIDVKSGSVILNYVNNEEIIKDDLTYSKDELAAINEYNDYKVANTKLTGESHGFVYINRSVLEDVNLKQISSSLQVSETEITKNAKFIVDTAQNLTFTDVTGTDIHFDLKHTKLVYSNNSDEAKAKETIIYTKESGAVYGYDISVSTVTKKDEPNE